MGGRVTQNNSADLARAGRLKKALESGAPPSFANPETSQGPHSENSSTASLFHSFHNPQNSELRLTYLEQMFQASPDGLSIADSSHHVLWANETFACMFDYTAQEVVGQSLENLVVPPDRLAESRWVSEALAKGERITLETKRRKKDGTLLDVSVSCAPLLLEGKMAGFYAGYHDISDRKRVEALELGALPRRREKQQRARSAAILRRSPQHCRRTDVRAQFLYRAL